MISLKPGVRINGISPEAVFAAFVADGIYHNNSQECVITSINDGKHKPFSKHYSGHALDLRTRHLLPGQAQLIAAQLRTALGTDYDVVLESDHIHVEFDPK